MSMESASNATGTDLKHSRRQRADPLLDRLPPHDLDAEQCIIGCALLNPNVVMSELISVIKDNTIFYDLRHQTIYENMVGMFELRQPIDLITLKGWLNDNGELEQVGGLAYLLQCQDIVPSAANLPTYLDRVKEKFLLRRMISACTAGAARIYDGEEGVQDVLDNIEKEVLAVRGGESKNKIQTPKTLVHECLNDIEARFANPGVVTGISTGLPDLDKMTNGLQPSDFIIIAARPSCGKTALMGTMVEHIAVDLKIPVGIFSLEMSAKALLMRSLCSRARVNIRNINEGFMAETDFPKLTNASGLLHAAPIYIDDESGLSIMQIRARARRMAQQFGIKALFIDYLQLAHSTSEKAKKNRQIEVGEISVGCKELAKELNIPVVALCQLNRDMEKQKGRKPKLSDLRESGNLEQDADLVGLLYKPNDGDDDDVQDESDADPVDLIIAKQRNGPTGTVHLTFLKPYTRFEAAAKFSDEDVPT